MDVFHRGLSFILQSWRLATRQDRIFLCGRKISNRPDCHTIGLSCSSTGISGRLDQHPTRDHATWYCWHKYQWRAYRMVHGSYQNIDLVHSKVLCCLVCNNCYSCFCFCLGQARILNSPHHTIHVYKAAIAAVHLSLISLSFLPACFTPLSRSTAESTANSNSHQKKPQPVRFGAQTDKWGTERVGVSPVVEWYEHEEESRVLLEKCDDLYQQFSETEGMPLSKS